MLAATFQPPAGPSTRSSTIPPLRPADTVFNTNLSVPLPLVRTNIPRLQAASIAASNELPIVAIKVRSVRNSRTLTDLGNDVERSNHQSVRKANVIRSTSESLCNRESRTAFGTLVTP